MNQKVYDIAIIGAGPAGLFGLFYASLRDMDALLIDSLEAPGGQLATLYPEKYIYDMPGFPKILAGQLATDMYEQATMHKPQDIVMGERVEHLTRDANSENFILESTGGQRWQARTVLITTGAGAFRPNKLDVPHIARLEGQYVHYFVKNRQVFKDRPVVIVGGGDSALDWVLNLHDFASEVNLVHRRDTFRAHEDTVHKVNALQHVQQYLHYEVKELDLGSGGDLEQVIIEHNKTGERLVLRADHLIVNLGFVADIGPIKNWGLDLQGHHIRVNSMMETNIRNVFAAGDITTYDGKLKLIATATSEAAIAVNTAKHRIDPSQRQQPAHSSSLFDRK